MDASPTSPTLEARMSAITAERASAVEDDAVKLTIAEIAGYLQEHISQRMAAYMVDLVDSRQIGRYARGEHAPTPPVQRRLREGYKVVRLLVEAYDDRTARSWLFGTNTRLDDQAPIEVFQHATDTQTFIDVLRAARQFASVDG